MHLIFFFTDWYGQLCTLPAALSIADGAETKAFFNTVAIDWDNNIVQYWLYFPGAIFCKKKMAVFKMQMEK